MRNLYAYNKQYNIINTGRVVSSVQDVDVLWSILFIDIIS